MISKYKYIYIWSRCFCNPCISRSNSHSYSVTPCISPWPNPSHTLDAKSDVIACIDMCMDPCPDPCPHPMSDVNQRHFRLGPIYQETRTYEYAGYHQDIVKYYQVSMQHSSSIFHDAQIRVLHLRAHRHITISQSIPKTQFPFLLKCI